MSTMTNGRRRFAELKKNKVMNVKIDFFKKAISSYEKQYETMTGEKTYESVEASINYIREYLIFLPEEDKKILATSLFCDVMRIRDIFKERIKIEIETEIARLNELKTNI